MPAPLELFCWVFPPGNAKRPVVIRDQEIRIYLRAVAEDGRPGALSGVRLEVRRPDGTVQVIDGDDIEAGDEPGTLFGRVQADQNRLWRYEWIHTGPVEGHINGSFTVQAGRVTPPGPDNPILTTEDLDPLATEGGGILRVKRITALPQAATPTGFRVLGVQDGLAKNIPVDGLVEGAVGDQLAPVVAGLSGKLDRDDDEVTGDLRVPSVPAQPTSAAPRQYVDDEVLRAKGALWVINNGTGTKPGTGAPTAPAADMIQGALNALKAEHGHGRLELVTNHRMEKNVVAPPDVELGFRLAPRAGRSTPAGNQIEASPHFRFDAGASIIAQHSLAGILALPTGFTAPVLRDNDPGLPWSVQGMMEGLDYQAGLSSKGTPFRVVGGNDPRPEDLLFQDLSAFGFAQIFESTGGTRMQFRNIYGDSEAGISVVQAGGAPTINRLVHRSIFGAGINYAFQFQVLSIANAGGLLALVCAPPKNPPYKPFSNYAGRYVTAGVKFWHTNGQLYRTAGSGVLGTDAPTLTSRGNQMIGEVRVNWYGAWTGDFLTTADKVPYPTGGFLKPGHSIVMAVPPRETYTGNETYPHWSTPGAPADIAADGGDILDFKLRGRMVVQGFGTITPETWTVILQCPYDAGFASYVGRYLTVVPALRFGSTFRSDDSDGAYIYDLVAKGPRNVIWANGSTHHIGFAGSEDPSVGEIEIDDINSITLIADRRASRFDVMGYAAKSQGTLLRIQAQGRNIIKFHGLLRGATYRAIDMVDGNAYVDANFEGAGSVVYSRANAGHLKLRWEGDKPILSGDGNQYPRRISQETTDYTGSGKYRALAYRGGQGVKLGYGSSLQPWLPNTTYAVNTVVWVTQLTGDEAGSDWLFRQDASPSGLSAPDGDGPQGTVTTVTDGSCAWVPVGPYVGGVDLVEVDEATGTVRVYAAAGGAQAPRQLVAEFVNGNPVLGGRWRHKETDREILSIRGQVRPAARSLSQFQTNDADDAASGLYRTAVVTNADGGPALAHAFENQPPVVYARQDWVASQVAAAVDGLLTEGEADTAIAAALAPYPTPAVLTWVGNSSPLPPQAFNAQAGDMTLTGQQSILSSWLLACQADKRCGYLRTGVYRLSGTTPTVTLSGVPVVLYGDGPRRSIIWMDDTYAGAALTFDDIWWGAAGVPIPTGVQPTEADGYVAAAPPLTAGQSFRGGLLLADFSVIGQMTSLTTKAWLDGSLDQRGIDFVRRLDNAYIGRMHFGNIQGAALRFRPGGAPTVGPRESTIEVIETRQCGWGAARPAIDILNDRVDAGGSDQVTIRRVKGANKHGPTLRVQHNGGAGTASFNHWIVDDFLVHGEGSWNSGVGYDPAIPLPGGEPWHHIEFLGAIDSMRAINIRVGHNIKGRDGDPDAYCVRIGAVGGQVPNGMLFTGQNRDSGERFLLVEAGTGIRCEISSAEGGLVTVGPGITGPVEIVPPPGEVLNLAVDPAVEHLVGLAQVGQTSTLPARVPAVEAAIRAKVGSGRTVARERHALYARTDGTTTTAGFGAVRDANVGVLSGVGLPAQLIAVEAAGMALMVYRARGMNTGAQRAEWWGVVLVQRLTNAASTTILAGAATARAPNESSGSTANAARLAVAVDTTLGGVTFAATWGGAADLTLDLQVFRLGQVASGNAASVQRMLENAAGAAIAGLLRQRPSGPYADDAAAIAAGIVRGGLYYKADGSVAAVGETGTPAPATISYVTERELAPARQVVLAAATALTVAAHQDARVTLAAGGSFSLAAATVGDGFRVVVVNLTGADYTIAGITGGTVRYDGNAAHTKIAAGRSAVIEVYSVSGTRYVDVTGGTIA